MSSSVWIPERPSILIGKSTSRMISSMGIMREHLAESTSKLPGYQFARKLLPRPIKELMIRLALRGLPKDAIIEPMVGGDQTGARRTHFKPHNRRLADYLGRDLSEWNR